MKHYNQEPDYEMLAEFAAKKNHFKGVDNDDLLCPLFFQDKKIIDLLISFLDAGFQAPDSTA